MAKKLLFGTNLKMYKNVEETVHYLEMLELEKKKIEDPDVKLFVIPSYTALYSAGKCADQSDIMLGAQNMCWADEGQFTGEISPGMLKELDVSVVMTGHSERRHIFHETEEELHKKVKAALAHGFTSLLCIGETSKEKACGISKEVLRCQLKTAYRDIPDRYVPRIWTAYEPVWSIGVGGTPAGAEYAEEMHTAIRECLREIFGNSGEDIPILYGGSVNPENAEELIVQKHVNGLFVGRSAWDAHAFGSLIRAAIHADRTIHKKENEYG